MSARPWKLRVDGTFVARTSFATRDAAVTQAGLEAEALGATVEAVDMTNGEVNEVIAVRPLSDPPVTNPACPCWSGCHFLHQPGCGCQLCELAPPARKPDASIKA